MSALGQIAALTRLLLRHWTRSSLAVGGAAKIGGPGRLAGVVLRLVFVLAIAQSFRSMAASAVKLGGPHSSAPGWLLTGALLFAGGFAAAQMLPAFRGAKLPLRAELLEALPLNASARIVLALAQNVFALVAAIGVALGAASPRAATGLAALLGVALFVAGSLAGLAAVALARLALSAHRVARLSWLAVAVSVLGGLLLQAAAMLGHARIFAPWHALLAPAARALAGEGPAPAAFAAPALLAAASVLVIARAERRGYDRLAAPPPGKPRRAAPARLTLVALDGLLTARETSVVLYAILLALPTIGVLALLVLTRRHMDVTRAETLGLVVSLLSFQIAAPLGLGLAARSASRDARARALLAPLTIVPADTLRGKERFLRRLLLPSTFAPLVLALAAPAAALPVVLTRAVALPVGMALFCSAAPSLAFLTGGLGAGQSTGSVAMSPATLLLLLPFVTSIAAPDPWAALLSLLLLGLITFEARRAALRCVRWLDDEADDVERDTPVWRALLVLGAFFAVQALAGQILNWALRGDAQGLQVGIAYAAGAAVLVLLTLTGREGPTLVWWPARRRWLLLLGPLAGLASGALAQLYLAALRRFGLPLPEAHVPSLDGLESVVLSAAVVLAAPVAEEVYFRGWLQSTVAGALPDARRRYAPLLVALGFALVHPSLSFAPVLVLGALAGGLYAAGGALLPAVLAHVAHNAVALFLASR